MLDRYGSPWQITRRQALGTLAVGGGLTLTAPQILAKESAMPKSEKHEFVYCFNTSTIRGQKLGIVGEIDVAATAGYGAIEPWLESLHEYVKQGHSVSDLAKRLRDAGLQVPSAIGFAQWIVDDPAQRKAGLEQAKRDMELVAKIGGTRIAAPPVGAHEKPGPDLLTIAERYRALLNLGEQQGVIPMVEVWGFSKTLSRLGEAACVAIESGHPQACILTDVYHLYKGGSGYEGLKLLAPGVLPVMHMNDYPAQPPRAEITDAHRVYPGDGVAPLTKILKTLRDTQGSCVLSLELFNRDLWKLDPLVVAKTGLQKMHLAVASVK